MPEKCPEKKRAKTDKALTAKKAGAKGPGRLQTCCNSFLIRVPENPHALRRY